MRADQLLADKTRKPELDLGGEPVSRQRLYGKAMEHLALNRATLKQLALLGAQPLQARRQQRLDRRGNLDCPAFACERDHLLQKQRVAVARHDHSRPSLRVETVTKRIKQSFGVLPNERLQKDGRGGQLAAAPARSVVEQLGTSCAQQQDRCAA